MQAYGTHLARELKEREETMINKTAALYSRTALNFPLPVYDTLWSIFSHHQTQQSHTTRKLLLALQVTVK
jgi:hypothetical protein